MQLAPRTDSVTNLHLRVVHELGVFYIPGKGEEIRFRSKRTPKEDGLVAVDLRSARDATVGTSFDLCGVTVNMRPARGNTSADAAKL